MTEHETESSVREIGWPTIGDVNTQDLVPNDVSARLKRGRNRDGPCRRGAVPLLKLLLVPHTLDQVSLEQAGFPDLEEIKSIYINVLAGPVTVGQPDGHRSNRMKPVPVDGSDVLTRLNGDVG